jgi:hypothetical protein
MFTLGANEPASLLRRAGSLVRGSGTSGAICWRCYEGAAAHTLLDRRLCRHSGGKGTAVLIWQHVFVLQCREQAVQN